MVNIVNFPENGRREKFEENLKVLARQSEVARKLLNKPVSFELVLFMDGSIDSCNEQLSEAMEMFHPNGNGGCVLCNDDYMFDIRCDHLMWSDGYTECVGGEEDNAVLVCGNHKGYLKMGIIYKDEPTKE